MAVSNAGRINLKMTFLVGLTKEHQLHKRWDADSQLQGTDFFGAKSQDPVQSVSCHERISEHV
jgi:hypothetical protein